MSAAAELRQAFAAIRHSLRSLLPHRTVKLSPTQPVQLYFETKIPWYTQWYIAWPLIAFDVIFVANTCELAWNRWTVPPPAEHPSKALPAPKRADAPESPEASGITTPGTSFADWPLQPAWMRAGVCTLAVLCGGMTGVALLNARRCIVRRLLFLPPSAAAPFHASAATSVPSGAAVGRRVFVQCASDLGAHTGRLFSLAQCRLQSAADAPGAMELWVRGSRGKFELSLAGARIGGDAVSPKKAREVLMQAYGHDGAVALERKSRWTSGPITRK